METTGQEGSNHLLACKHRAVRTLCAAHTGGQPNHSKRHRCYLRPLYARQLCCAQLLQAKLPCVRCKDACCVPHETHSQRIEPLSIPRNVLPRTSKEYPDFQRPVRCDQSIKLMVDNSIFLFITLLVICCYV